MKKLLIMLLLGALALPSHSYAQAPASAAAPSSASSSRVAHIPILIYHSVRPYYPGITNLVKEFTVPPDVFDDQMKYLRDNGFTVVTFDTVWAYFQTGAPLPPKPVMITLDDGWENQYIYAYPILKKYKYTGIFYIYSGAIGAKHFLTWTEVKEMVAGNMIIADHTQTHPELPKISDPALLKQEIAGSKEAIEKEIGVAVKDFAYPFGAYSAASMQTVKDAGYRSGRTVHAGTKADSGAPFLIDGLIITGDFNRFVSLVNK
jgi:peptidoglycan/xylan/chitin deacetylase (PgdA/CDA1 family)